MAIVEDAYTDGLTSLGDLDGDGLAEVGFGLPWSTFSNSEIAWWYVRPGASFVGQSLLYGRCAGRDGERPRLRHRSANVHGRFLDGDGVPDFAVGQEPGSNNASLWFLSGAALLAAGTLSAETDALRSVEGLGSDEAARHFANVGDLDGDGRADVATVVVDTAGQYGDGNHVAATVCRGASLVDPATTMTVDGSVDGRDRDGLVETLGDSSTATGCPSSQRSSPRSAPPWSTRTRSRSCRAACWRRASTWRRRRSPSGA